MDINIVLSLAQREIKDALRKKWLWLCSASMALLALLLSHAGVAAAGYAGLGGFGRTAASLINVVVLFVPLLGFIAGASTIAADREKGTLLYLLSQPVTRSEVFAGKALGAAGSIFVAVLTGFGISGIALARSGSSDAQAYFYFSVFTGLLLIVSTSMGLLIGTSVKKSSTAYVASLILWLFFGFLSDLAVLSFGMASSPSPKFLFHLILLNPMQAFKVGAIYSLHSSLDPLGPAGQFAMLQYGSSVLFVSAGVLIAWFLATFAFTSFLFSKKAHT